MFFFARADTAAPTVESAVKCQARRVRMPSPVATSIGDQCAKDAPSNIAGGGDGTLVCCVCLTDGTFGDEGLFSRMRTSEAQLHMLPCCGRARSATRICSRCLAQICSAPTPSCPMCRQRLQYDARLGPQVASGPQQLTEPASKALSYVTALLNAILLVLLWPFNKALEAALESVFSRGPV